MHFTPAADNVFCPKQSRYAFHGNVARPPAALQLCLRSIEGNSTTSAQWCGGFLVRFDTFFILFALHKESVLLLCFTSLLCFLELVQFAQSAHMLIQVTDS